MGQIPALQSDLVKDSSVVPAMLMFCCAVLFDFLIKINFHIVLLLKHQHEAKANVSFVIPRLL